MNLLKLQSYNTEKEYRDAPEVNYSTLKSMIEDPESLIAERKDLSNIPAIKIGSLVDCLLTDSENVDNLFYHKQINIPTASLLKLAEHISKSEYFKEMVDSRVVDHVLDKVYELGLWSSTKKEELLIKKFNNELFWEYLESVIESDGKMIVTPDEYNTAQNCAMLLATHKYTKDIFTISGSNIEAIDQFKYRFNLNGIDCKVMLDKVIVDHKNKIIYPYDIKTGFDKSERFNNNVLKYRYDLQAVMYSEALKSICRDINEFKDYVVKDFKFVYISTGKTNYPLKWAINSYQYEKSLKGWDTPSNYHFKGLFELLDEYNWRITTNIYDRSKEVVDNKGNMIILIS